MAGIARLRVGGARTGEARDAEADEHVENRAGDCARSKASESGVCTQQWVARRGPGKITPGGSWLGAFLSGESFALFRREPGSQVGVDVKVILTPPCIFCIESH